MQQPIVRVQTHILGDLEALLRDVSNAKWTDEELYRSINRAIEGWSGRVSFPAAVYVTTNAETYEYDLSHYVPSPASVQQKPTGAETWEEVAGWEVYPHYTLSTLRLRSPQAGQVRVIYAAGNGPVPLVPAGMTLVSDLTANNITSTGINNNNKYPVGRTGYVLIRDEWIQYLSSTLANSDTTLHNLQRGALGGAAVDHPASTLVYWGVAAPNVGLFEQLLNQAAAHAHGYMLSGSPARETEHHQWAMRWHQQRADEFWLTYSPAWSTRLLIPAIQRTIYA